MIARAREVWPADQRWLAYQATCSQLTGDRRYAELYDYERFVQPYELEPPAGYETIEAFHAELVPYLIEQHKLQHHPIDQSLRHGTQTARDLTQDSTPVVRAFLDSLEEPIARYREHLGHDDKHPFLRRNRGDAQIVGCWSVRLGRGGYHVNHVHPEGWISSAYYVELPDEVTVDDENEHSGWIQFGEPRMPTPGAKAGFLVKPAVGRLVLFPSYMWHGTIPTRSNQPRMTIAFDVVTRPAR